MTEYLDVEGGRIAYDVPGEAPLVVLVPGMGTRRDFYSSLASQLVAAGYRVAEADLRGLAEASTGWASYTRPDTAADTLALIRHLGGPAVMVGHSFSGGSATIAAAQAPELVTAVAEIGPFTRVPKLSPGARVANPLYRKGTLLLLRTGLTGSVSAWTRYLDHAFPGPKPAGYREMISALQAHLREPGRMTATRKMGLSRPTDAEARLGNIRCPALVIMGTLDPDWPDPRAEADAIVATMPAGLGRAVMIDGAGHSPPPQSPAQAAVAMLPFLKEHTGA